MPSKNDFFIGEALIGEAPDLAHLDVMIGSKQGPVGFAFAQSLSQPSKGHGSLLAVIRPNLCPKPQTIIIPKVTIANLDQANKIFGPAQAAVAKAVADLVDEGAIPESKLDEWVIIVNVFIHPDAKDYRRIYQYNYGATKLAIRRALDNYPPLKKILFDKDRAKHPVAGIKVPKLWRPPYLQVALDHPSMEHQAKVIKDLPKSDRIILEVGTPFLKRYGMDAIRRVREMAPNKYIVADLKTLDVGKLEVDDAFKATADGVVCSGLASASSIDKFLLEAERMGIDGIIDMMEVADPIAKLKNLKQIPRVVILHRGIDSEQSGSFSGSDEAQRKKWGYVPMIKDFYKNDKLLSGRDRVLVAVAGGISPNTAFNAVDIGADILIVGRYITSSKDVKNSTRRIINILPGYSDIDLKRIHDEDDDDEALMKQIGDNNSIHKPQKKKLLEEKKIIRDTQ
ncbi:MAG: bifunctional 5,6,7,8-tetrahydromethanopterin hydro-lyase/3-hexulose-6-phosphate synthase [Candidatus Lokiarchaeota archaeon]|nr:bifunctional 5,6,7,8-tetrahydromethanopterin hydro-lyase/3-hexulose-6-phosphate synthase [Candidatus Lokiarchaeota archaeon]